MTTSHGTRAATTGSGAPERRTTVALAALYCLMFVGIFIAGSSSDISPESSGEKVIKEFTSSSAAVQVGGYGLVVAAAVLVFWGAAMRRLLMSAQRSWTADAVLGGTIAMALTLVGWTVTLFALKDAVDSGIPEVAQSVNIMNNANFVPGMLGLTCTMIGVGLTSLRTGSLPRWLAIASIVVGALGPVGPVGFIPFALFPIWIIVVSALVRTTPDA
jgi:hypothetical protein